MTAPFVMLGAADAAACEGDACLLPSRSEDVGQQAAPPMPTRPAASALVVAALDGGDDL
jgi:hypothetical protein